MKGDRPTHLSRRRILRVGYVPLCDCAPLVMAQELGLFEKYGLHVHLSREAGWATVRDKIIYGELDAAHALAPMVIAATLGLGSAACECVTGLVLGVNGNAITLSQTVWDADAPDGATLRRFAEAPGRRLVFGIPFLYSSHHFLLRAWLRERGLVPGRNVLFVVVPPPQMAANLQAGHLDGFCVGEPWNSVAAEGRLGWRAATSQQIAPGHPEKVLMVRREFADARAEEHSRLIAALYEACNFCVDPRNRERVIETLGESQYVNAPAAALRQGCEFTLADQEGMEPLEAHEPSADKAAWVIDHLAESGLLAARPGNSNVFRADLFQTGIQHCLRNETTKPTTRPGR